MKTDIIKEMISCVRNLKTHMLVHANSKLSVDTLFIHPTLMKNLIMHEFFKEYFYLPTIESHSTWRVLNVHGCVINVKLNSLMTEGSYCFSPNADAKRFERKNNA